VINNEFAKKPTGPETYPDISGRVHPGNFYRSTRNSFIEVGSKYEVCTSWKQTVRSWARLITAFPIGFLNGNSHYVYTSNMCFHSMHQVKCLPLRTRTQIGLKRKPTPSSPHRKKNSSWSAFKTSPPRQQTNRRFSWFTGWDEWCIELPSASALLWDFGTCNSDGVFSSHCIHNASCDKFHQRVPSIQLSMHRIHFCITHTRNASGYWLPCHAPF